ncbi:hypothetical protein AB1K54_15530 [Microbacterium sp. BWT-B31]|uniref:hypothetical protein n=1 Tax=Microbacterium sp. BWT-B31 TaxID=3232072 RepID=UPI0035280546
MSIADETVLALWGGAIAAYVGRGVRKIPTADETALFAFTPDHFDQLLPLVKEALSAADAVTLDGVAREHAQATVMARLREALPGLDETGVDALAWRWGYITYGG